MEGEAQTEAGGRATVRSLLINRLDEAGMKPARGQSQAALEAMQKHLADRLAYMAPDSLQMLANLIMDEAIKPGAAQFRWPSEMVIRAIAQSIQPAPPKEKIYTSWLGSIEGPKAEAGGYLVTLYRWLVKHDRVVLPGDLTLTILPQAEEDRARERRFRKYAEDDNASAEELRWLAAWDADLATAREIIATAKAAREAKKADKQEGQAA